MTPTFQTVGIVGTGAMGRGIAQMAAQAGSAVLLFDLQPGAAEAARKALADTWQTLVDKSKLDAQKRDIHARAVVLCQRTFGTFPL